MNDLDKWEEILPQGERTVQIKYGATAMVPQARLCWDFQIAERFEEPYTNTQIFTPDEFQRINVDEVVNPLEMEHITHSIEASINDSFRKYTIEEILKND